MQKDKISNQIPLVFGVIVYLAILVWIYTSGNSSRLAYPTDDTYIGYATSENLGLHGVWGINANEFAGASSCPLWICLQALVIRLLGGHIWMSFALVFLCSIGLLFQVDHIGRRENWPPVFRLVALMLLVIFIPLGPMTFLGMEHILQTILTIWIFDIIWRMPASGAIPRRTILELCAACLLNAALRYEGLVLTFFLTIVLLWRRQWKAALLAVFASAIPVSIYAVFSIAHGWAWAPASVLLKKSFADNAYSSYQHVGVLDSICRLGERLPTAFMHPNMPVLAGVLLLPIGTMICAKLVFCAQMPWRRCFEVLFMLAGIVGTHFIFTHTGWFFRYEAYLVGISVFISACACGALILHNKLTLAHPVPILKIILLLTALCASLFPLVSRGLTAARVTSQSMKNICDQQCEMARFLKQYYPGAVVAANDIGAISCGQNARIVDLMGLAHHDVFWARQNGAFNTDFIQKICEQEQVELAILYPQWFSGPCELPSEWVCVGLLHIEQNYICAGPTVAFYAMKPGSENKLRQNLKLFAPTLPSDVYVDVFPPNDVSH
jgi:hypothetical protein